MAAPLRCAAMNYAWGTPAPHSLVYRLAIAGDHQAAALDGDRRPFAELWIGTHPNAPSHVHGKDGEVPLRTVVGGELPFLAKVLAVGKALSIQAHPDKARARTLHASDPLHYPDSNHKPEMTIALTRFEALFGFRPLTEIRAHLDATPELRDLLGCDAEIDLKGADSKTVLAALLSRLLTAAPATVELHIKALVTRLQAEKKRTPDLEASRLFLQIAADFPGDVGLFFVYFLNHVVLEPGDALFMGANQIHAYLSGDCIEVMANSDNVVRAGLTPKFKDVDTLVAMLTYECGTPDAFILKPTEHPNSASLPSGAAISVYDPPIEEFTVHRITAADGSSVSLAPVFCHSILISVGTARGTLRHKNSTVSKISFCFGSVFLLESRADVTFECESESGALELYQFFCQSDKKLFDLRHDLNQKKNSGNE